MSKNMVGIIAGSGLGDALAEHINNAENLSMNTPFGSPSDQIITGTIAETPVAFLNRHGKGHILSPGCVPFAANIFALKELGVTAIIASGAVGSLREDIRPGHLVIADQIIDKTFRRKGSFFDQLGAVHCELAQPFCSRLRGALIKTAQNLEMTVHPKGTYVCMEGPQFSTRAESLMHRIWGGDLIGMTAMPEARLAREAQICYALVTMPSDYDCWKPHEENKEKQTLIREIIVNLQAATDNAVKLIKAVLLSGTRLCTDNCPCRKSLELAVWTSPDRIDPEMKKQLQILFE
ncbi:MAG: S-methyl-5'-thioadenosine phosphorylase [Planctomycetota bacterium]